MRFEARDAGSSPAGDANLRKIMHWILQENLKDDKDYNRLVETIERFDLPHSFHKIVPFTGEIFPKLSLDHKNVICMGSYSLRHTAKSYDWNPGVFDIGDCSFDIQRHHWGEHMLNYDSEVVKFKNAELSEDKMFIRPVDDSKAFTGTVVSRDEFNEWKNKVASMDDDHYSSFGDTIIQIARLKKIYAEYRFWIVNQRVVTSSLYKRGDDVIYSSQVDRHVHNFVIKILRTKDRMMEPTLKVENTGWAPNDAFVLDVCETDEGMKIVEINTLNSAGFYACNMTNLVLQLEHSFNKELP